MPPAQSSLTPQPVLWEILAKTVVAHTLTYFLVGAVAFRIFNYRATLADPGSNFRSADDVLVRAGVLFQPIRGVLFGVVFYLLRGVLFAQPNGWLVMWIMLVLVGILSTFATAPGSVEGFIYTTATSRENWGGSIEVLVQSLLLSVVTFYWVTNPEAEWVTWLLTGLFVLALVATALGLLSLKLRAAGG